MRLLLGPGLLIAVALALPGFPDTGGVASAALYIVAPVGAAGAVEGRCVAPKIPTPPLLSVLQTAELFHDADGNGLLDPGDMIYYSAEIVNRFTQPLEGLKFFVFLPSELVPEALPRDWDRVNFWKVSALVAQLPRIEAGGRSRVGFAARFAGGSDVPPALSINGLVCGPDIVLMADNALTPSVLDPTTVVVRETVGRAGSLPRQTVRFTKRARSDSSTLAKIIREKDTVKFTVRYVPLYRGGNVELLDFIPRPLRVIPESVWPEGVEIVELEGMTILRLHSADVSPGAALEFRYDAVLEHVPPLPFLATHAMAITEAGIFFSDDPDSADEGDPTAVLFPFVTEDKAPAEWGDTPCVIPVILEREGGGWELRWARCSRVEGELPPRSLVFWGIVKLPVDRISEGSTLGILLSQVPEGVSVGKVYVPRFYGLPIFTPLTEGTRETLNLAGNFCEGLYIPLLVEFPGDRPRITGVISDEDL